MSFKKALLAVTAAASLFAAGAASSADALGNARREMETNYLGTLAVSRAFQPVLAKNGGGALVNLISVIAHSNPYAVSLAELSSAPRPCPLNMVMTLDMARPFGSVLLSALDGLV